MFFVDATSPICFSKVCHLLSFKSVPLSRALSSLIFSRALYRVSADCHAPLFPTVRVAQNVSSIQLRSSKVPHNSLRYWRSYAKLHWYNLTASTLCDLLYSFWALRKWRTMSQNSTSVQPHHVTSTAYPRSRLKAGKT